jgi:hypothetical protein
MVFSYYPEEDYKKDGTIPGGLRTVIHIDNQRYTSALQRIVDLKNLKVVALEPPDSLIHEAISIAEHALKGEG